MQLIFEDNARERLLQFLGCNADDKAETPAAPTEAKADAVEGEEPGEKEEGAAAAEPSFPDAPPSAVTEEDSAVKRALLVGNFAAAVDGCFEKGQLADALLLASCGGAELWEQTRIK